MRIASIATKNLKAYEDFAETFADVNIIAGGNGTGKSSTLAFITGLFGKGNARMLRPGTEIGWIKARFVNDEGTEYWDVERVYEPNKVRTPTVESSVTGKLGGAKSQVTGVEFLKSIMDTVSIDPINRAMNATEEEQAQILLDTMPLKLETAELETATSELGPTEVPGMAAHIKNSARLSGLDAIKNVYDAIYDHRRNVNRDAKTKSIHAAEMRATLPADGIHVSPESEVSRLSGELSSLVEADSKERQSLEHGLGEARLHLKTIHDHAISEINDDIDARIKELEVERSNRQGEVKTQFSADTDALRDAHQKALQAITDARQPERDRLNKELALAQQQAMESAGHRKTIEIAQANEAQAAELERRSEAMTKSLKSLDGVKQALLDRLPIKGLTMQGGIIYLGGVALSEINTAERAKFWLKISAMRAGDLGVVVMDGAECFAPDTMKAVVDACLKTGLQWFLGRVDAGPFRIEKIDA